MRHVRDVTVTWGVRPSQGVGRTACSSPDTLGDVTFAVFLVCTGNLCRSVAAEQLLTAVLRGHPVELMSAGTHAQNGASAHPLTVQALADSGSAPFTHAAQRLVPEAVAVADLVLTATRDHRLAVVEADPTAARRTFTVLEFARLVRADGDGRGTLAELRDSAAASRAGAPATAADDLADPVQGSYADHVRMVQTLAPAVAVIADAFAHVSPRLQQTSL